MIKFLLIVNNQGVVRITKYYQHVDSPQRRCLETEVGRLCLTRDQKQSNFFDYEDYTIVFRRYVSLVFIAGVSKDENELAVFELFHHIVETLNKYFEKLSEIHILYNMDRVHMILDEMIANGFIAETSQTRALAPLQLLTATRK